MSQGIVAVRKVQQEAHAQRLQGIGVLQGPLVGGDGRVAVPGDPFQHLHQRCHVELRGVFRFQRELVHGVAAGMNAGRVAWQSDARDGIARHFGQ